MANSLQMIDVLKRELRARGLTYARVARHLGLSEASVKRMFSQRNFTLRRLDQICTLAGTEFSDLMRTLVEEDSLISQLTPEQEREIIANKKLFVVAVCALNHLSFEQIVRLYDIAPAECVQLLLRLDRLKFIRLLPNNRIKLLVARTFSWIPDGPIARYFTEQAHNEYFRSRFDRADEFMLVVNGMLSDASAAAMVTRLKRVSREFSELHNEDVKLPLSERRARSLLVAVRHWEPQAFVELRRGARTPAREKAATPGALRPRSSR
jgi:transcriptional regulator with XRE-family HTH domain